MSGYEAKRRIKDYSHPYRGKKIRQKRSESAQEQRTKLYESSQQTTTNISLSRCLSVCLPPSLCLCLSARLCLPVRLSVRLTLSVCLSAFLCLSVCLSVCLSAFLCLDLCLSVRPSVCPPFSVSLSLCLCQSVCLSYFSVCLSVSPSLCGGQDIYFHLLTSSLPPSPLTVR